MYWLYQPQEGMPMGPHPLPSIDKMVDEITRCEFLNFLDAFKGYHQIFMAKEDEEKTSFITLEGIFLLPCYGIHIVHIESDISVHSEPII